MSERLSLRSNILVPSTAGKKGKPAGVRQEEAEAACVADMFALYLAEGQSLGGVVKQLMRLGIPNPSGKARWSLMTVRGILTNPTYTGTVYAGRERSVPKRKRLSPLQPIGRRTSSQETSCEAWIEVGQVPAIVTKEQFEMVQAKLAHHQSWASRNNTAHQYLLRAMRSPWALWPLVQRTILQDARLLLLPW